MVECGTETLRPYNEEKQEQKREAWKRMLRPVQALSYLTHKNKMKRKYIVLGWLFINYLHYNPEFLKLEEPSQYTD